jgi:prepilin-type N-terminal cleavage/methylation domain-containing protein
MRAAAVSRRPSAQRPFNNQIETAMTRESPRRAGFTLIELLIAMVIIAILASIAINLFWRAKDRGLRASLESDLRNAAVQQEVYFERNSRYATAPTEIPEYGGSPGVILTINYVAHNGWGGVTSHQSLPATTCGLLIGEAPVGSAGPATQPGVIACN